MPLIKSKSKAAFSHNVGAEMDSGKSQKQALAIAYAVKRRGKYKGGMIAQADTDADMDKLARMKAASQGNVKGLYSGEGDEYGDSVGDMHNESKKYPKEYMSDERSIGPLDDEEHEMHSKPMGMDEHEELARALAVKGGLKHFDEGGIVNDEPHSQRMVGDTTQFLSDEEDLESPFQDPHQGRSDEKEMKEMYGSEYDRLSDLDNERDDEDQNAARRQTLDSIMQKRMRLGRR